MKEREMLLRKLSSIQFASWELHVYLDTHEDDRQAQSKFNYYVEKYKQISEEYQEKYGPLYPVESARNCSWLEGPWPWESLSEGE